jgi:hypothetical protein
MTTQNNTIHFLMLAGQKRWLSAEQLARTWDSWPCSASCPKTESEPEQELIIHMQHSILLTVLTRVTHLTDSVPGRQGLGQPSLRLGTRNGKISFISNTYISELTMPVLEVQ